MEYTIWKNLKRLQNGDTTYGIKTLDTVFPDRGRPNKTGGMKTQETRENNKQRQNDPKDKRKHKH